MAVDLIGCQEPRLQSIPDGSTDKGDLAVEFCRWAGLTLLPWQEELLRDTYRTDDNGDWAAKEVVVSVARQNGKGEYLLALELCDVFLFHADEILHTAQLMDTAISAQKRLWDVVSGNDELMYWGNDAEDPALLPVMKTSNGKEALVFPALGQMGANGPKGATILFRTRSHKTGRGLSFNRIIYDECYMLPIEIFAGINSTTTARANAQKVFISSPVDRLEHVHGEIFSAKRWAGIDGAKGMLFKEWSAEWTDDPFSLETWKKANPSLGPVTQVSELESGANSAKNSESIRRKFFIESLGCGDWYPRDRDRDKEAEPVIPFGTWNDLVSDPPGLGADCCLAVDVAPGGERVALVTAARTEKGAHLMLAPLDKFDRDETQRFVVAAVEQQDPQAVLLDPKGFTGPFRYDLESVDVEPGLMRVGGVTAACELLLQWVGEGRVTHDGNPRWVEALQVATFRQIGKYGRAFTRREGSGSICELVAASFALWGLQEYAPVAPVAKAPERVYSAPAAQPLTASGAANYGGRVREMKF